MEEKGTSLVGPSAMYMNAICWVANNIANGHQAEKCLHFNGKWRQVCLACGAVNIEDRWYRLTEIDALVPQLEYQTDQDTPPHQSRIPL